MTPAALLTGLRPDLAGCGPEAQRTITDGEHWRDHAPPLELTQHRLPAFGTFAITVFDRQQFLLAVWTGADHHQGAEPIIIQPDIEMDSIHPDIDILTPAQLAAAKLGIFFLPAGSQPGDGSR